ncbi:two-component system, OmpR family, response regulator CpxR [Microbulbifer donghaiensis]|uniref:Two-component system, OmpR family, response regulator CpxR n=1 Tax=Microbulbifer donghaiensis TaxID=494016 RepID=A0A1M4WXA5_9GAMM|nr:response regulator transcription factor [Microbulbifer donghaiensis]SHE85693.1 two-component system, OmpR family, response regulator CpxR [Microbulbifer donghaiensis]
MSRILLVDDDTELTDLLQEFLTGEGFEVTVANDGGRGLELAQSQGFDALVLDVMLPVHNGFELLRKLREEASPTSRSLPVLMLTAKGDTVDRIVGLEMGADDYLPKPCNPRELAARLRAVLRRGRVEPEGADDSLISGALRLLPSEHQGYWNDQLLSLTGAEFAVLKVLVQHAGEVVSKEVLTESALGRKLMPYDRSIDVHVSNIRKKLAELGASRDLIINIRGAGYMLTQSKSG